MDGMWTGNRGQRKPGKCYIPSRAFGILMQSRTGEQRHDSHTLRPYQTAESKPGSCRGCRKVETGENARCSLELRTGHHETLKPASGQRVSAINDGA
jgi:hypothetical protein